MQFPKGYEWLASVGPLPRVLQEAFALFGVAEVVGRGSNRTIMGWRDELNQAGIAITGYSDDDIPWCGLFEAIIQHRAGKPVIAGPLWARNWANWGSKADRASLGDTIVLVRNGGGHVCNYIAETPSTYVVIGGNQGNRVSITQVDKARVIAVRRGPFKIAQPPSVRPYFVKSAGGKVSNNEA